MTTSFYNAITGSKTFQSSVDIWGDNIANINSVGYKENIPEFATLFAKATTTSNVTSDLGVGSRLSSTAINTQQGSIKQTDNKFDLAIGGKGWFKVEKNNQFFYTRTGSFTKDENSNLVLDNGAKLQAVVANNIIKKENYYTINTQIDPISSLKSSQTSSVKIPDNLLLPALPTTKIDFKTNLKNDEKLYTNNYATEDIDFSALYSKDKTDMKIRSGDSIIVGFGKGISKNDTLVQTEICINESNEEQIFDFKINNNPINISFPPNTKKELIIDTLAKEFDKYNIHYEKKDSSIIVKDDNEIILKSNNDTIESSVIKKLFYSPHPNSNSEFSTIKDFKNELQNLADSIYQNIKIDFKEGRIEIENSSNKTIQTSIIKNNSENLFNNLNSLNTIIAPTKKAFSQEFFENKQSFSGNIIDKDSNTDNVQLEFIKFKVNSQETLFKGNIIVKDDKGNIISKKEELFKFNSQGFLISPKKTNITSPQNININFDLTAFSKTKSKIEYEFIQDGVKEGYLKDYQIEENGIINAIFSNAKSVSIARIPVYSFQNEQGLESKGENLFIETSNSSKGIELDLNAPNHPKILNHSLEMSNVTLSKAMTELIIQQKAFNAAAKTISTSDEMIQKAINMKK